MIELQNIKNRFNIVGNSPLLNHALDVAVQVAPTDLSVLIVGESGVGKEAFSKIIHELSPRKHNPFLAVNCGAIPEGTIDSELFGHEKGAFTGAVDSRKGYFETVNGGTIFLDEIGEMPLGTQARLLRVLESGEYIRVGATKVQKTDVRIIAATNKDLLHAGQTGKFREDLYYRLSTVPIRVPSLKDRKEDIVLLFRKFMVDFSDKYKTESVQLSEDAKQLLMNYPWPGNIRELKNIAEQIAVLSKSNLLSAEDLMQYLPQYNNAVTNHLPVLAQEVRSAQEFSNERELLYKLFFDMKKDVTELKKMFVELMKNPTMAAHVAEYAKDNLLPDLSVYNDNSSYAVSPTVEPAQPVVLAPTAPIAPIATHEEIEEVLNIADKEKELIVKALKKHKNKRKDAAADLGISERTLYRKLKEYDIHL